MSDPQLAISNEFMDALARLPKAQRKKVQDFAKKFRADPKSAAINYEKIQNMADERVRTVRIDQKYRAVVLHPDTGNTYVLVWVDNHDEGQDFTTSDWRFIRSLVRPAPDDLFIVADPRQRIYHEPTQLADGDIHISDRVHRLQINYRTTEQIRRWAMGRSSGMISPDLCDSSWSEIATHSLFSGPEPVLLDNADQQTESIAIVELIHSLKGDFPLEEIAIVVRAGWLLKQLKSTLKHEGVEFTVLDGDRVDGSGVQLATMHRVKGLEFRCVVIAGLADAVFPTRYRGRDDDEQARLRHIAAAQNLFYVAATRARDQLYVSTVGGFAKSKFLTGGKP